MRKMTPRRIAAHKGGRTARAPEARIRPQTLQRIHETMRERSKSFADLLEESYGGNEMANLIAQRFDEQYVSVADIKAAGAKWNANGAVYQFPDSSYGRFTDIKNGAKEQALRFIASDEVLDAEDRI